MTVQELIKQLEKLPPDLPVFRASCEGGYNEVKKIYRQRMVVNRYPSQWVETYDVPAYRQRGFKAVVI